ncbi:MAG TPA: hypothetical protein VGC41_20885, partial [Kofleriaceae bacterium]
DPTRIDVFPLVNRGQPKLHEMPEPILQIASHPRSDLLACVGADHGRLFIVDLDGRSGLRTIGPEHIDRVEAAALVTGRMVGVLAAQARHPLAFVQLDGREASESVAMPQTLPLPREHEADPVAKPSTLYGNDVQEVPTTVTLQGSLAALASDAPQAVATLAQTIAKQVAPRPAPVRPAAKPVAAPAVSLADRFNTWRDRTRNQLPRNADSSGPVATDPRLSWRDELATWARGVITNSVERGAIPGDPSLAAIAQRFELEQHLLPALALLYGAHLAGENGVAPVDLARVLGRNWDEALGNGALASTMLATFRDSRVRLSPAVQRTLDNSPVTSGTLVGSPGPIMLVNACIVVAPEDQPLGLVAEATLPAAGGAILAVHPHADPLDAVIEARARGAVAMLRATPHAIERVPAHVTAIFVIDDEALAEHLELPRL